MFPIYFQSEAPMIQRPAQVFGHRCQCATTLATNNVSQQSDTNINMANCTTSFCLYFNTLFQTIQETKLSYLFKQKNSNAENITTIKAK